MTRFGVLLVFILVSQATAQIEFEPKRLDLGSLLQMETKIISVTIKNDSAEALDPKLFGFDCGCFKLTEALTSVAARSSATIELEVRTGYFSGPQRKSLRWRQGDFLATADIVFDVAPDFVISPEIHQLGAIRRGEARTVSYVIAARSGLTAELVVLQTPRGATAELQQLEAENESRRWELRLHYTVAKSARPGAFELPILLETQGARIPHLNLGLAGHVQLELAATPGLIDFGRIKVGELGSFQLQLRALDDQEFCILGLGPRAELQIVEPSAATSVSHDCKFTLKQSLAPGTHRGMVEIHTSHGIEPILRLAWRVRVVEDEK